MQRNDINVTVDGELLKVATKTRLVSDQLVLLLHGIGDSKEDFDRIWSHDGFASYSVCAADLIGFGESDKPPHFSYRVEAQACVIAAVVNQLAVSSVHVVGHSVGGAVAVLLCAELGPVVSSLISVEGNLIAEDCGIITRETAAADPEEFRDRDFPALLTRVEAEQRKKDVVDLSRCSVQAFHALARSVVDWSDSGQLLDQFLALRIPKMYVYGDENSGYPVLKELSGVPSIAVRNSGHNPMDDNPDEFYRTCAEFINESHRSEP